LIPATEPRRGVQHATYERPDAPAPHRHGDELTRGTTGLRVYSDEPIQPSPRPPAKIEELALPPLAASSTNPLPRVANWFLIFVADPPLLCHEDENSATLDENLQLSPITAPYVTNPR
jgi:hypothetical protein